MPRDLGLADRLRARGLKVVEVDGWRTRGSDAFDPRSSVNHHTAGAAKGNAPSLGVCINGRSDLPGPLCNVLLARDGTCYVIAAGKANHAGKGGWRGLTGNSTVYGLEIENVGTQAEPWTDEIKRTAYQVHAAFLEGIAPERRIDPCHHKEWAPGRKTDAHDPWTGEELSQGVRDALAPPTHDEEDDVPRNYALEADTTVDGKLYRKGQFLCVNGDVRWEVTPDAQPELVRQWGQPVPINSVAFAFIVRSTALDMLGLRSLPPDQRTQLREIHESLKD